jgi:hypothetical protein
MKNHKLTMLSKLKLCEKRVCITNCRNPEMPLDTYSGTEWSGAFRMREAHTDDY